MNNLFGAVWIFLVGVLPCPADTRVEAVPEGGLQPEVAVAPDGTVHLVYLRGAPGAAEVRYTSRRPGQPWRPGETVNSIPGTGIAVGTIRGPQLALGEKGTVQVVWNGAPSGKSTHSPLWYARKPGKEPGFEAQKDLLGKMTALDGGASIAADGKGRCFVVWHGEAAPGGAAPGEAAGSGESQRLVFVRTSKDDGRTFGEAEPANPAAPGVCACCSLRALTSPGGPLGIFFRNASSTEHRAMTLLSLTEGKGEPREIESWNIAACPMSSAALVMVGPRLLGAWETAGQVRVGWVSGDPAAPVTAAHREAKHPSLAVSPQGTILVAWVVGSGWNRGGSAAWQEFGQDLKPTANRGQTGGVPVWGRVAAYADPQGGFVMLR